jgi:hypothetical protein
VRKTHFRDRGDRRVVYIREPARTILDQSAILFARFVRITEQPNE